MTPVKGAKEELAKTDPETAENQLIFPSDETLAKLQPYPQLSLEEEREATEAMQKVTGRVSACAGAGGSVPYLLLAPGLLWLGVFFLIPALNQLNVSLWSGTPETGQAFDWNFVELRATRSATTPSTSCARWATRRWRRCWRS